jgi:hypothetical protein
LVTAVLLVALLDASAAVAQGDDAWGFSPMWVANQD